MLLTGARGTLCKLLCVAATVVLALIVYYVYNRISSVQTDDLAGEVTERLPPSDSVFYRFDKAAIVTNQARCASIATNILKKGGNAVDAAITALLCDGIACPQSMGLGGGFLMTVYNRTSRQSYSINAREKAPSRATQNMFHGNAKAAQTGALAAGVPGELLGYWEAYQRFGGGVAWKDLFAEVIDLALSGIPISAHLSKNIKLYESHIRNSAELTDLFIHKDTNKTKGMADTYAWPSLAKTLRIISEEGGHALHNGSLTKTFVKDIQDAGGIITEEDMNNYNVVIEAPLTTKLKNEDTLWTTPLPGSGILLTFMMRLLQDLVPAPSELLWHQRFTEVMKYAYAYRGYLGDVADNVNNPYNGSIHRVVQELQSDKLVNEIKEQISDTRTWQNIDHYNGKFLASEDHGTANIVVLSAEGDAVVATSTVNLVFGSRFVSKSTGILLNDELDDFSSPNITNYFQIPPSPANFIQPGKRPLSSMCPTIVTDKDGNVKLAIGSAGGTKITTSIAQVAMLNMWMNNTLKAAVDAPRIHHQLYPMKYGYEYGVLKPIIQGMRAIGHVTMQLPSVFTSSITAVSTVNSNGSVSANADFRRPGGVDGF